MAFSPHPGIFLIEVDVVSKYIRKLGTSAISTHMSRYCEKERVTDLEAGKKFLSISAFDQNLSMYPASVLALFSP